MRRPLIPLAVVAATTLIALAGCGNVNADAVRAEFAGRAGVIEARTYCTQDLPFAFNCTVTVSVERDITVSQLEDLLPLMRTGLHGAPRGEIVVEWGSWDEPDLEIRFGPDGRLSSGVSDRALAQAFVEGIADPRVTEFVLDHFSTGKGPSAEISYQNPETHPDAADAKGGQNNVAIASMRRVQELIPGTTVEVTTPDLAIEASDGSVPEAELGLYLAIVREFPVLYARVEHGLLDVRLPNFTDPGPADAFARQQPQYSSVPFVTITSDGSVSASDIDPERAADLNAVVEAARALPQAPTARVEYDRVTFTVPDAEAARDIDAALSSLPEYARVGVRYSNADMTASREPGGVLAIEQVISLAADPSVSNVEITQSSLRDDGSHHVDVDAVDDASPYDLGAALARSGVGELPGAWVVVSSRGNAYWVVSFYTDQPLRLETDRWLTRDQAADFTRGWEAGK